MNEDDEKNMTHEQISEAYYNQLIARKYLLVLGYTDDGSPITMMTDKMWEDFPNAARWFSIRENDLFNSLWFKGYVEVTSDQDGNFDIKVDPNIFNLDFEDLDYFELNTLHSLLNYLILEGRRLSNGRDI